MGVYIKDFKKPTYCMECPLTFDYDCMIQHEQRDSLIDQYKHCPLVEVKTPHGRLIDAEVAEEVMLDVMCGTGYQTQAMDVVRSDFYTPTIVEAEVE